MLNINLNNRFAILYLLPFVIGSLSVFSFQPYNFILINFIIFPIFFYFIVYINKKSKVTYRKKPYKKNLFIFGLLFGFGFYLSGVSWITNLHLIKILKFYTIRPNIYTFIFKFVYCISGFMGWTTFKT